MLSALLCSVLGAQLAFADKIEGVLPSPKPTASQSYSIQKGDNDWSLARKFGCTVKEIHALNPGVNWNKLQLGQTIKVPGGTAKGKPAAKAQAQTTSTSKKVVKTSSPVKQVSATGSGQMAKVAKTDVILRVGPGTKYDRVAKLNKGQTAVVLERRSGWTKIKFESGTAGWLRDDLVAVTPVAKADLVAKKEEGLPLTPGTAVDKPIDKVPDGQSTKTLDLPDSETVPPVDAASGDVSTVVVPPPLKPALRPGEDTIANAFDGKVARIKADNVIVRSGPSTTSDRKVLVSKGRTADLLSQDGDWFKIKFSGGTIGWVRNDLIELVSADVVAAEKAKEESADLEVDMNRVEKVLSTAKSKMGTRYVYGASRSSAFDCSGFVVWVMSKNGVSVPRTSAQQARVGKSVAKGSLQKGDLVFFKTTRGSSRVSHVGIYLGGGKFIHASSGGGKVQVNSLSEGYYQKRYVTARRLPALAK